MQRKPVKKKLVFFKSRNKNKPIIMADLQHHLLL